MPPTEADQPLMARALQLARRGEGRVEPNPMVGCVIVRDGQIVGEGWHQRFGGPHAEVEALAAAGAAARGGTAYVTLEPCCHHGKTPPCTAALIDAGVTRVVAGCTDPNPQVAGQGLAQLAKAGVQTAVGIAEAEAADLIAPFRKLMQQGRPWIIAKWAMSLDGKIAAADGSSQWISGPESRAEVHKLRGRVDAVLVGRGTARRDDPLLTARPPGPRTPVRIVLDSQATLSLESQLVRTAGDGPVIVAASRQASSQRIAALEKQGVEVLSLSEQDHAARFESLLAELGRRHMTNVLVEGGGQVFGSLLALGAIDEVYAFVAPKLLGGAAAPGPVGGAGVAGIDAAIHLAAPEIMPFGNDVLIRARVRHD